MTHEEQRQAVVFQARFEFFDQMFAPPGARAERGSTFDNLQTNGQVVPENWRHFPLKDVARVEQYWQAVLPLDWPGGRHPPEWCAAFYTWCVQQAGLSSARARLMKPGNWLDFAGALGLRQLPPGALPVPGDLAYFKRNQHHAVVVEVDEVRRTFDSIDGNQPAICMYKGRTLTSVAAFYSLEPLLHEEAAPQG
jgi:hypothetical protein